MCKTRDRDLVTDKLFDLGGDAVSFVSHDNKSFGPELLLVDIFTSQESPVTREILPHEPGDKVDKIQVENIHPEDCTHACLNGFRVKNVCTIVITKYIPDAEPITDTEYRADVTGVLDSVEDDGEAVFYLVRVVFFDRDFGQSDDFRQGFEIGYPSHFDLVDLDNVV